MHLDIYKIGNALKMQCLDMTLTFMHNKLHLTIKYSLNLNNIIYLN